MRPPTYEELIAHLEDCLAHKITDPEMGRWAMLASFTMRPFEWVDARKDEATLIYFLDRIFKASPEGHDYEASVFHELLHDIRRVLAGETTWRFKEQVGGTWFKSLKAGEATMREEIFKLSGLPWSAVESGYDMTCQGSIRGKEMRMENVTVARTNGDERGTNGEGDERGHS